MSADILKRTTFVVADANASAEFFADVLGWKRWYDNELEVDARFPPTGAPHMAKAHLVIMEAEDPIIGKVGLLQYLDVEVENGLDPNRTNVRMGDAVLVIQTKDPDGIYKRALDKGANIVSPPVDWKVPSPDGASTIDLRTVGLFDINGIYIEASAQQQIV